MMGVRKRRKVSDRALSAAMRELGSRGGRARAANLTPERRAEISERAAAAARAKQLACAHEVTEERMVGQELRRYCHSCRRRLPQP